MKLSKLGTTLCIAVALAAVSGCAHKGSMEKAGEKADNATEKAGDSVRNSTENAGDKIEDATDKR